MAIFEGRQAIPSGEIVRQKRDRKLRLEVSCRIPSGVTAFFLAGFGSAVGFEGMRSFSCLDVSFALAVLFSTVRTHWGSSGIYSHRCADIV
jgi:hypothetical protein